jgi:hypothetical protein
MLMPVSVEALAVYVTDYAVLVENSRISVADGCALSALHI